MVYCAVLAACCMDSHGFEPWHKPPPMLVDMSASIERLSCHADPHTVSRCCTRCESEDYTSEKACKESTLALKPRADVTRSPKEGHQWLHEKDLCPPIFFKK